MAATQINRFKRLRIELYLFLRLDFVNALTRNNFNKARDKFLPDSTLSPPNMHCSSVLPTKICLYRSSRASFNLKNAQTSASFRWRTLMSRLQDARRSDIPSYSEIVTRPFSNMYGSTSKGSTSLRILLRCCRILILFSFSSTSTTVADSISPWQLKRQSSRTGHGKFSAEDIERNLMRQAFGNDDHSYDRLRFR